MLDPLSHDFVWQNALVNVTPKTFIDWNRAVFRLFWHWKSQLGRPRIPTELRALIGAMAIDNPSWGEERIANELLLKLGIQILPRTVPKYMPKRPRGQPRGDQRWPTLFESTQQRFGPVTSVSSRQQRFGQHLHGHYDDSGKPPLRP
jgi:putative transposase